MNSIFGDDDFKVQINKIIEIINMSQQEYKGTFSPILLSAIIIMKDIRAIDPRVHDYIINKRIFVIR